MLSEKRTAEGNNEFMLTYFVVEGMLAPKLKRAWVSVKVGSDHGNPAAITFETTTPGAESLSKVSLQFLITFV